MRSTPVAARLAALIGSACLLLIVAPAPALGAELPSGFSETTVFTGLQEPTAVRFSPDGRVFVAEKAGKILVYDNLDDPSPEYLRRPARAGL